jgi:iron(III) transport system substrate-binding protein
MRPATHIYTISLVSSLLYHLEEAEALEVIEGWVANDPTYIDSDSRMVETVASGGCDVAVVNHYYVANALAENPDLNIEVFFPNQDTSGTFFNINGAGVTANALNREEAIAFIEFLSSLEGQAGTTEGFPGSNNEFPTNPEAELSEGILAILGDQEVQFDLTYPLWDYGTYQQPAVELLENAGYGFEESES